MRLKSGPRKVEYLFKLLMAEAEIDPVALTSAGLNVLFPIDIGVAMGPS